MDGQESQPQLREHSVAELVKELSDQTLTLVRQELKLARAEMVEKGRQARGGAGLLGGAGMFAGLALLSLTACVIAALSTGMEVWLAALIVTVVYAAIAGVLALKGRQRVSEATPPVPQQTVTTVKEDVQWAKNQMPSGSR